MKEYRKQIVISLFACIGQITFGYSAGWPSPVIPKLMDANQFLETPSGFEINWIVSNMFVGLIIGMIVSGPISNMLGRKPCLVVGGMTGTFSFLALALIKNPYSLMVFRVTLGIGMSTIFATNLVYIGEIASKEIRGMLLGFTGIFNSIGFLLVFSVGTYVSYEVVNYIGMMLGVVFVTGVIFAPETPVYHIIKGRNEEAKATLLALGRKEDAENVSQMKKEIEGNQNSKAWKTLFKLKSNRKALMITLVLNILQQASGIDTMLTYTTSIFELSDSSVAPSIATIIVGVVNLASGIITSLLVDRFGRRVLLLLSTFLTGVALMILGIYIYFYNIGNAVAYNIRWLPLPVYILYCISYSFGFGILPATLLGEMFQLDVRSAGSALCLGISWVVGFVCLSTFAYIIAGAGIHVAFATYSAVCGLAFLFTVFFVPETKGMSLIDVQKILSQ